MGTYITICTSLDGSFLSPSSCARVLVCINCLGDVYAWERTLIEKEERRGKEISVFVTCTSTFFVKS